ncbi:MAG: hypothetical protein IJ778_04915 [Alphaproteobacteria bacterium]|nr:hypothetical protein [Alphaproteobacteria bacterium]
MKKITAFLAMLMLNGCYSVPAQPVYYEDSYTTAYAAPVYDSSVYVVQEQPATYYQSQTSFVYISDEPDIIYYDSPFVAPRPHYYRHAPAPLMHHSHHAPHHHARHRMYPHHGGKHHNLPIKHGGKPEKLPGKGAPHHGGRK